MSEPISTIPARPEVSQRQVLTVLEAPAGLESTSARVPVPPVTSKGQTTIPKPVRDHLHLKPGDRVEFIVQDDGSVVLVPATVDVADLEGVLPKPKAPVSLADMEAAIRTKSGRL